MDRLVPVIDQVLDSLHRGHLQVSNADEVREVLSMLRTLALEGDGEPTPYAAHKEAAEE